MAYYMIPKYLRFRKELPKTATMRIQKFKLREEGLTSGCVMRKRIRKEEDSRINTGRKKCCVDIECRGENQRGEISIPGTATVILPSREHGP